MVINPMNWFKKKSEVRMTEAAGASVDNEKGWRKLTGDADRTLSPLTQARVQELAVYLWRSNPLANRLVELPLAYLLAEGVELVVGDDEAKKWLKSFWTDPINNMNIKLEKKVRELAIYGEQCYTVFVNEFTGHVRLGYLDPGLIQSIVIDPDNVEQPIGVITKKDKKGKYKKYRTIVNGDEAVFTKRTQIIRDGFDDGECFYFTVNDLSTSSRGHSDMLSQMDWLDAHDQSLFGDLERSGFMRGFVWDVSMRGATQEEVDKRAKQITTPSPGSVRVHNDSEVWTAVSPDLKAADSETLSKSIKNHILGGSTIPEHFYGSGGDVNRATAGEMSEPTLKIFTMRQTFIGHMLAEIGTFVIRQKLKVFYGVSIEEANATSEIQGAFDCSVQWPEMTAKDTSKYAAALVQVVTAAATGIDRGLMARETAVSLIVMVAGQLGLEIDAATELDLALAEMAEQKEADSFTVGESEDNE